MKVNAVNKKTITITLCLLWCTEKGTSLLIILAQNSYSQFNHEETLDKPKSEVQPTEQLASILQVGKILKNEERWRKGHRLEETKKIWQLIARWDPLWNPGIRKDVIRKIDEIFFPFYLCIFGWRLITQFCGFLSYINKNQP